MRKNHLKFTQKEKEIDMVKFKILLKNNGNATRKNPTKIQTMTVESNKAKTIIIHLTQRKKLCKQKMAENNSKLSLSGKFDFAPEDILDKLLLFDLKKTSEDKTFDSILEKIPDENDIYYMEHREGTNTLGLKKDPKNAGKDELITMF